MNEPTDQFQTGQLHLVRIDPSQPARRTLGNRLLEDFPQDADGPSVECRERLGGLLRYYYRAAA